LRGLRKETVLVRVRTRDDLPWGGRGRADRPVESADITASGRVWQVRRIL